MDEQQEAFEKALAAMNAAYEARTAELQTRLEREAS